LDGLKPGLAVDAKIKADGMACESEVFGILNKPNNDFKMEFGFLKSVLFGVISLHFDIIIMYILTC
jgi:hypothetical protein